VTQASKILGEAGSHSGVMNLSCETLDEITNANLNAEGAGILDKP
jgi:hypothetical protein